MRQFNKGNSDRGTSLWTIEALYARAFLDAKMQDTITSKVHGKQYKGLLKRNFGGKRQPMTKSRKSNPKNHLR